MCNFLKFLFKKSNTTDQFFGSSDKLCAKSKWGILCKLSRIDTEVPDKIKGRTHDHIERSDIVSFLKTVAYNDLLEYPFCIQKSESPDFMITVKDKTIGLEVCAATSKEIEEEKIELEKAYEETQKPVSKFRGGGAPLIGDAVEHMFADLVSARIIDKAGKLVNYQKADSYELLIYYDGIISTILEDNLNLALKLLKERLNKFINPFDKVSIIISRCLAYNCLKDFKLYVLYDYRKVIYITDSDAD